jgi:pimeloyl-ACP methyl ester carboxylesterase
MTVTFSLPAPSHGVLIRRGGEGIAGPKSTLTPSSAAAGPPPALLGLLEAPRALAEYASFTAITPLLSAGREGHGRPVLVLPGLLANDHSTRPLRRLLNSTGYTAYGWRLGTNIGPTRRIISGMDAVLGEITDLHGKPASVIGWSLGGMFGSDLVLRHPEAVDRLITLGSPLYIADPRHSRGSRFYNKYAAAHLADYSIDRWRATGVASVPVTSIFSKTDGVVRWHTCLHPPGPWRENIEVYSSHCGLGFHPAAAYAILDRLAAPTDPWPKFVPPAWLAIHFPAQVDRSQDSRAMEIA